MATLRSATNNIPECTPKALTHRIAKFRTAKASGAGSSNSTGKEDGSANEDGTATPKAKGTKGKKAAGETKAKAKKVKKAEGERTPSPAPGEGEEGLATPPDTAVKKRAGVKRKSVSPNAAVDDEEPDSKKVKVEEGVEGATEVGGGEIAA